MATRLGLPEGCSGGLAVGTIRIALATDLRRNAFARSACGKTHVVVVFRHHEAFIQAESALAIVDAGRPERLSSKRKRPTETAGRFQFCDEAFDQAPSTLAGSTFTPGPIDEVTATRWM